MSKQKKYIKYPKERALLSDVLPFEVPITFSNRYFYNFLVNNKIEVRGNKITYSNLLSGKKLDAFISLMEILFFRDISDEGEWKFRKIPFTYRISHKEKDFRELALIHPINQLKLIELYEEFKESIIYSCSISNFSIRRPNEVAKFTFFNDKLHQTNKGDKSDFLELSGKEYENIKTFFSYKKYTNIYRFYEDYRYQRAEKKYDHLFKFDIAKCFDSIYTHSIVWAVLGLENVKENVNESKSTFAGHFDHFIQYSNYGETNGIIIGPEFSRIFAEIILQKIDRTIENKLKAKEIYLKKQYELYRYVDDYFLFCDNIELKEEILTILKHELKKYKLSVNNSKSKDYNKPIITEITIAKDKIIELFSNSPKFKIDEIVSSSTDNESEEDGQVLSLINHRFDLSFDPNKLATKYKIIIKESLIDYKDVLNYSLAILNGKIENNLKQFEKVIGDYLLLEIEGKLSSKELIKIRNIEDTFSNHLEGFIDFIFFIYSVSPRVNSTIKVSHILAVIIKFYNEKFKLPDGTLKYKYSENNRERVFKKILDESTFILNKNALNEYSQIESLYLLTVLRDLGKGYKFSEIILSKFLNSKGDDASLTIEKNTLNYFSIVISIFYIGHSKKYPKLKLSLLNYTLDYISSFPKEKRGKSSEITHLILDLLACPYLDADFKKDLLHLYRNDNSPSERSKTQIDVENIIAFNKDQKYWFTKWERFDLTKELTNKKSQEVYS